MVHRRQPVLCREVQHLALLSIDKWTCARNERVGAVRFCSRECAVKILQASYLKRLKFESQRLGRSLHLCEGQVSPRINGHPEEGHPGNLGEGFLEQFQPFAI